MSVFEVKDAHYRQFAKYNQLKKKKAVPVVPDGRFSEPGVLISGYSVVSTEHFFHAGSSRRWGRQGPCPLELTYKRREIVSNKYKRSFGVKMNFAKK